VTQAGSLLNGEKVDAVICVAGGWAGGNATSKGDEFLIVNIFHAIIILYVFSINYCGPDSSVGVATDYGLDSQGIESWWG
jgi:hypothetical protein